YVKDKKVLIDTKSGVKILYLGIDELTNKAVEAEVDMGAPIWDPKRIPALIEENRVVSYPINIYGNVYKVTCVSMGNPHAVVFMDYIKHLELEKLGPKFEKNALFPHGINTEFVRVIDRQNVEMRVWERGSGETLGCGTGSCASVVAAIENGFCDADEYVNVHLQGGLLRIKLDSKINNNTVWMKGECVKAFEGVIEFDSR
ncbi:MAG: diaminopimelate epimerase, partial [Clostridiales bacterium]|nr:diaminopimelate epimerase [Clostridiales bacterium]